MKGRREGKYALLVVFLAAMVLSIVAVVCVSVYAAEGARQPAPNPFPPAVVAPPAPPPEPPAIDVKRDKEKTVYTIGPGDRRYEMEERDRAWDMLRNMTPIVDERRRPVPRNVPAQPAK